MTIFLITGCASGLGRHLTGAALRRGHQVLATDLDFDALQEAAEEDAWIHGSKAERCALLPLDVTSPEDWDHALDAVPERFEAPLDVLINNAGYLDPGWVHELSPEQIERQLAVNTRGTILGTRAAAQVMIGPAEDTGPAGGHRGHIVNIASLAGVAAIPGISVYSASKFAVRGFSLAAAEELAPRGIAVTAVCPDAIATPMLDLQLDYEEAALSFSAPRILAVEDVEDVLFRVVLPKRPLEVLLPRSRGWTAKLANLFPRITRPIAARLRKVGERKRQKLRQAPGGGTGAEPPPGDRSPGSETPP